VVVYRGLLVTFLLRFFFNFGIEAVVINFVVVKIPWVGLVRAKHHEKLFLRTSVALNAVNV